MVMNNRFHHAQGTDIPIVGKWNSIFNDICQNTRGHIRILVGGHQGWGTWIPPSFGYAPDQFHAPLSPCSNGFREDRIS